MNIEALADTFKLAQAAAVAADSGDDGGTCNMDTPAFTIPRVREATIETGPCRAAERGIGRARGGGRRLAYRCRQRDQALRTQGQEGRSGAMSTAVYLRVSTDRQEHRSQLRAVLEWLDAKGMSWRDVLWFRDRGISSAKLSRPAFDRLMEECAAGNVKTIVVYKLDRIGRWDTDDYLCWRISMKRLGVSLVSIAGEASDFDSLTDKIMALVLAHADREWLLAHRRRVSAGVKASKVLKAGRWGIQRPEHPLASEIEWRRLPGLLAEGRAVVDLCRELGCSRSALYRHPAFRTSRGLD